MPHTVFWVWHVSFYRVGTLFHFARSQLRFKLPVLTGVLGEAPAQCLLCPLERSSGTGRAMRRAALYCRVSTLHGQTTTNQELALREVADRMQCQIVALYTDEVSGAKGR